MTTSPIPISPIRMRLPDMVANIRSWAHRYENIRAMRERAMDLESLGYRIETYDAYQYIVFDSMEQAAIYKLTYSD